ERVAKRDDMEWVLEGLMFLRQGVAKMFEDPAAVPLPEVMTKDEFDRYFARWWLIGAVGGQSAIVAFFLVVGQLIGILFAGRTLGQFLFGFSVVDASGAHASRLRLLARWLVAWCPLLLPFLFYVVEASIQPGSEFYYGAIGLGALYWILLITSAIVNPTRGLLDRWTGCWIVPS
ncbi:MAG: RDD family protein, partial [Planctomycetota bacterium]